MKYWTKYRQSDKQWKTTWFLNREEIEGFIKKQKLAGYEAEFSSITQEWDRQKNIGPADPNYHEDSLFVYC